MTVALVVIDYLMACLVTNDFFFSIITVLLICTVFLFSLNFRVLSLFDLLIPILTVFIIFIIGNVSRISLLCVYILFSFRGFYTKKTIKVMLVTEIICLCLIIFAYLFGFNAQYDTEIWRPLQGVSVRRRSFGFIHPNQFMIRLFVINVLVYMYSDKARWHLLWFFITLIFYHFTQSRTTVLLSVFLLIASILFKSRWNKVLKGSVWKITIALSFVIMTGVSICLSLFFDQTILDTILTGRLALNKSFLMNGLTFFGNESIEGAVFDNSYIHMLLTKGILYFIIYNCIIAYYLYKTKFTIKRLIIVLAILFDAFMEVVLLQNMFLLLIPLALSQQTMEKQHGTKAHSLLLVRSSGKV